MQGVFRAGLLLRVCWWWRAVVLLMCRHVPEEEIAYGPAAWLWDYLRRSGASGFLLPLSGGADSSSTAAIVGCMCQMVLDEISQGNQQVQKDAVRCAHSGGVQDTP